jgi:hypothetical protein
LFFFAHIFSQKSKKSDSEAETPTVNDVYYLPTIQLILECFKKLFAFRSFYTDSASQTLFEEIAGLMMMCVDAEMNPCNVAQPRSFFFIIFLLPLSSLVCSYFFSSQSTINDEFDFFPERVTVDRALEWAFNFFAQFAPFIHDFDTAKYFQISNPSISNNQKFFFESVINF